MKKILLILLVCFGISLNGKSENLKVIQVSIDNSTFLYFPSKIEKVDNPLRDYYDHVYEGNELKFTAKEENVEYETNITVRTENGVYGFILKYKAKPEKLYHFLEQKDAVKIFKEIQVNKKDYTANKAVPIKDYNGKDDPLCKKVFEDPTDKVLTGVVVDKFFFGLQKIFVHENRLYFKVIVDNQTNINYDVDFIKFSIKDKKKLKKAAIQENYKDPLFVYKPISIIKHEEVKEVVFVIEKFTIPSKQNLYLEIHEKGGSRNLNFMITKKHILKAEII